MVNTAKFQTDLHLYSKIQVIFNKLYQLLYLQLLHIKPDATTYILTSGQFF